MDINEVDDFLYQASPSSVSKIVLGDKGLGDDDLRSFWPPKAKDLLP